MTNHFGNKDALGHVVERRAQAIKEMAEAHGTEIPGHISAGADAAREMAVVLLLIWTIVASPSLLLIATFGLGYLVWKVGRSAWLGWARLERLHRVIEQERWEIEHHRPQERDELRALYSAKGFEGKLLEEVCDVLMADSDRLLRVMLEEELGLTLHAYEHPLKQALGAGIGALTGLIICSASLFIPIAGLSIGTLITLIISTLVAAKAEDNRPLPSLVWMVALGALAWGITHFTLQLALTK